VADGRFYSRTCTDPACCPHEGTPFDPTTSSAAASAVLAGMVALPDRATLAAGLAPVTGPSRDAMAEATVDAAQYVLDLIETVAPTPGAEPDMSPQTTLGGALLEAGRQQLAELQRRYRARQPVEARQAALVSVLLEVPSVREYAARSCTGEAWQVEMWTDLLRRAEPDFTTAPATLLALAALQAGDGALADIAVRRALQADPADPLAHLLAEAIAVGIDPTTVAALLAG
jgi:hypothetical protein